MRQRTLGLIGVGLLVAALLSSATVALAERFSDPGAPGAGGSGMMGSWGQAGPGPNQGMGGTVGGAGGMMGGSYGPGGMMSGGGGMMGGQMGGPVQSTSPSAAGSLSQQAAATATIDRPTNTITYHSAQVQIVALASPDTGPDMTWNVDGLVNPTIVIPKGAAVTVDFFNADNGTVHGWELTATPPPYQDMAMMYAGVALPGAFAMPVAPPTAQTWFGRTVQFTAADVGTFYYLCPVPGHAAQGMFGKLVIQ